jgi:hypothetical protein
MMRNNRRSALVINDNFARGGGGCGWLGPPLFSVFANAGAGSRGQLLHMTIDTYLTSYAQSSQEFLSLTLVLTHTYSQIIGSLSDSWSASSYSLLLSLSHVHFLQPTVFILPMYSTIKLSYKIKSYIIPYLGREGDNL